MTADHQSGSNQSGESFKTLSPLVKDISVPPDGFGMDMMKDYDNVNNT